MKGTPDCVFGVKAFRVLIRAQWNLAYLLTTLFSKNVRKRNFEFLPLTNFRGVQSSKFVNLGHFWRFLVCHSVTFTSEKLNFSELSHLGRWHPLVKSEFQNFEFGRFGRALKFQNFGSNFFFHFFGWKLHKTYRKMKITKKKFFLIKNFWT